MRPVYVVFAGVNGAGKSTFFRTGLWRSEGMPRTMARVNSDEIVLAQGGDPAASADQLRAGREAVRLIEEHLSRCRSFNQETTLTGHAVLRNMRQARDAGYRVILYYLGVDAPDVAVKRIAHRVEAGGHDIDTAAVRRRYRASLGNLPRALDLCDEATIFDNTIEFVALARWKAGTLAWVGDLSKHGTWFMNAVRDDTLWRRTPDRASLSGNKNALRGGRFIQNGAGERT